MIVCAKCNRALRPKKGSGAVSRPQAFYLAGLLLFASFGAFGVNQNGCLAPTAILRPAVGLCQSFGAETTSVCAALTIASANASTSETSGPETETPKAEIASIPAMLCRANFIELKNPSARWSAADKDETSEAVEIILAHKKRERIALLICAAFLSALLMTHTVRESVKRLSGKR